MKRNFSIDEDIYIVIDGYRFDLHGDFSFDRFSYDVISQESLIDCGSLPSNQSIRLRFIGIDFLKVKEPDAAYPRKEARCINFIGFLRVEDADIMNGFSPDDGSSDVHFIIGLHDGSAIKVGAEEVIASLV